MGERYQMAKDYMAQEAARKAIVEAALQEEEKNTEAWYEEREAMRRAIEAKHESFLEYKSNVKKMLLTEALKRIYMGSIKNPSPRECSLCESLVGNYVHERGADELLYGFNHKTMFLEGLQSLVEKYYVTLTEDANEDDSSSMAIDRNKLDDFYKELDNTDDIADVTNTIRLRVANAEEEFVNRVQQDKENLKSIIKDTAQRVQDARPGLDNDHDISDDDGDDFSGDVHTDDDPGVDVPDQEDDEETAIQKEAVYMAKDKIQGLQERPQTVFERMAKGLAESVMKDAELRQEFLGENGRLDMGKVIESSRCMYTLLEMVSTLKIENVDAAYVEDTINSI